MPNSVGIKLESAIKGYIAATYQGVGEELNGVTLNLGKTPETNTAVSHINLFAGDTGGPLADVGNYEIPFVFEVRTDFDKQASETEASLRLRHGQRVSAILGIFGNDRKLTVRAALMALDAELGVSSYWKETESEDIDETRIETRLVFIFEAYLV